MLRKAVYWPSAGVAKYREFEETRQLKDDEVLVKNHYSLISQGTEHVWLVNDKAHNIIGTTFTFIPGYSAAGVIEKVGSKVKGFKPGDRVIGNPFYGAHSNYVFIPQDRLLHHVPDNVSLDDALFAYLGMTSFFTLSKLGLILGQSIAIVGCGVIGQIAIQASKAAGLHPIVALDVKEDRLQLAKKLGADIVVNSNDSDAVDKVIKDLGGGVDGAIDVSGSNAGENMAIHLTKKMGKLVFCTANNDYANLNYGEFFGKSLNMYGDYVNNEPDRENKAIEDYLWLVGEKKVDAPDHADTIYQPTEENIEKLYQKVLKHEPMKNPVFKWN